MRVAIYTLGCKVNQYETQAMETELTGRGHTLVPFGRSADACIINTCTVTAVSDHKSRQAIRRARKSCPHGVVAVCGCYAQTDPRSVAALEVDLVGGASGRLAFLDDVERLAHNKIMSTGSKDTSPEKSKDDLSSPLVTTVNIMSTRIFEELPAGGLSQRTRAMLKVEDGCVNFCSYCIIPYARGPVRSLPPDRAAAEAGRLQKEGYREIVVTGIEISSWGQDLPGRPPLADLIETICTAAPHCRIRLGSLEPRTVTPEFCRRLSSLHNLCPHFHLSLQSGCDETLKRMNRKYDTARYYESVTLLRQWFERPGITTDLIVGFPGESEEEFARTLAFMEQCAFTSMHIFPYSRRPGTPAADMPAQVSNSEKELRAHRACACADALRQSYLQGWIGQTLPVLFEEEVPDGSGLWRGYAPNYTEVKAPSSVSLHNIDRLVRITSAEEGCLLGELL